jgi:hypothetical protein
MVVKVRGNKENYVIFFLLIAESAAVINTYLGSYYSFMKQFDFPHIYILVTVPEARPPSLLHL